LFAVGDQGGLRDTAALRPLSFCVRPRPTVVVVVCESVRSFPRVMYLDARGESSSTRCSCRVEKFIQTNYRLHGRPPTDESQSASTLCVSDCLSVYSTPSVCVCVCVCVSVCLCVSSSYIVVSRSALCYCLLMSSDCLYSPYHSCASVKDCPTELLSAKVNIMAITALL